MCLENCSPLRCQLSTTASKATKFAVYRCKMGKKMAQKCEMQLLIAFFFHENYTYEVNWKFD